MKKILIGSPVNQKKEILSEFLQSIQELETNSLHVDYMFIDNNEDPDSSKILVDFKDKQHDHCILLKSYNIDQYVCDNQTHYWKERIIWKVAGMKDLIIEYAKVKEYDYIFLIDSDIVLHPETLTQLISAKKEIITNIFWTKWQPDTIEMPQVWISDEYSLYKKRTLEQQSDEDVARQVYKFLAMLRQPGVYEVGGLGACTLISRKALLGGVSFKEINNLSFWGEDRHFCIRAVALGYSLFVDTRQPAYHIYREEDLAGVEEYKKTSKTLILS